MTDPVAVAWADQFGALLRDKVKLMVKAVAHSGLDPLFHMFEDPEEGDSYRLGYVEGLFLLWPLDDESESAIVLDIEALGVIRG